MDADRKCITWKHLYKNIYKKEDWSFWGLFDFDKISNGRATIKAECAIEWTNEIEKYREFVQKHGPQENYKGFKISGDADFGNLKKNANGCNLFIPDAAAQMHKFPNFSIIPSTGCMNNKKGFSYQDRFHIFIFVLSEYFTRQTEERREYVENELFMKAGRMSYEAIKDAIDTLNDFLSFFDDIYDYCDKIYHLNGEEGQKYVEDLIRAGEAIKTGKKKYDVEEYCHLACQYWEIKKKVLLQRIPQDKQYLIYKNIDEIDDLI